MGSLIVNYGLMGSSKSSSLQQEAYNLEQSGKIVILAKPEVDEKGGNQIVSRFTGVYHRPVDILLKKDETIIEACYRNKINLLEVDVIIFDETQFLSKDQVYQLWLLSKKTKLQIICYSLGTDFMADFFPGSAALLCYSDEKNELIRRCEHCGLKPAVFNARKVDGNFVSEGDQIVIDGKSCRVQYLSFCGDCYYKLVKEPLHKDDEIDQYLQEMMNMCSTKEYVLQKTDKN